MARSLPNQTQENLQPTRAEIAHMALHLSLHRGQSHGYEPQDWTLAHELLSDGYRRLYLDQQRQDWERWMQADGAESP